MNVLCRRVGVVMEWLTQTLVNNAMMLTMITMITVLVSSVLFCSLVVLYQRVGHTMDVLCPFISVLCHSD